MNRLRQFWSNLRSSFWFVPALIVAASIGVALAFIEVDSIGGKQWLASWPRLLGVTGVPRFNTRALAGCSLGASSDLGACG